MAKEKTVLLIDDEQGFLEALVHALEYEFDGLEILTARTGQTGLEILSARRVDLVTVDIMMPPGPALESTVTSHSTGLYLCREIRKKYPYLPIFCITVVNDNGVVNEMKQLGVRFIKKGETPLQTVINLIRSRLTGVAYSTDPRDRGNSRRN